MTESSSGGRRAFLKKLLAGTAAGVFTIYKQPGLAELLADEPPDPDLVSKDRDYGFVVDVGKCIGCGYCVQACAAENNVPAGNFRTWVEQYVVTDDGAHVDSPNGGMNSFKEVSPELQSEAMRAFYVPKLCNHCRNAPCVQVCPVGATFIAPGGFVLVDPEHCIGCSYCVQACPYGVRFINPEVHMADKCTWCYHRVARGLDPACVTVCPTGARVFGERNDPDGPIAKVVEKDDWRTLKPQMHTNCRVYYVNLPREVV
jgi:tetrathionate reductase subunit B